MEKMNREMEEVFQPHLNTMHQQLSDLTAVSVNLLRNGHSYVNHSLCYESTILRLQQRLNKQLKRYFDDVLHNVFYDLPIGVTVSIAIKATKNGRFKLPRKLKKKIKKLNSNHNWNSIRNNIFCYFKIKTNDENNIDLEFYKKM